MVSCVGQKWSDLWLPAHCVTPPAAQRCELLAIGIRSWSSSEFTEGQLGSKPSPKEDPSGASLSKHSFRCIHRNPNPPRETEEVVEKLEASASGCLDSYPQIHLFLARACWWAAWNLRSIEIIPGTLAAFDWVMMRTKSNFYKVSLIRTSGEKAQILGHPSGSQMQILALRLLVASAVFLLWVVSKHHENTLPHCWITL